MADVDRDQKTEDATPRRLEQMRQKGQVAVSPDVSAAAALAGALAVLAALGPRMAQDVATFSSRALALRDASRPLEALAQWGSVLAGLLAPVLLATALLAILSVLAQTRLLFRLSAMAPDPERLNPLKGLERVLPGRTVLRELLKSGLKVAIVVGVVYFTIDRAFARFAVLPATSPEVAARAVGGVAASAAAYGLVALAVLAAIDYVLARRRFAEDAKMARHEVVREHKEQEGDPLLKGKRRQRARELAKQRALSDVRQATVLVTNPTHIAVALRYDPERDAAPVMLAQGVEDVALAMRAEARRHGVPIVENRPLARALHSSGKVGKAIPFELYEAAARVIAHVLSLRGGRAEQGGAA